MLKNENLNNWYIKYKIYFHIIPALASINGRVASARQWLLRVQSSARRHQHSAHISLP